MKNTLKILGVTALAALITFSFASCKEASGTNIGAPDGSDTLKDGDTPPDGGIIITTPGTATYISTDEVGNRYTLEITEKVGARYVAKDGDNFKLTVELYQDENYSLALVYSGTVSSAENNNTEVKIAINVNGKLLNITIKGVEMTVIDGEEGIVDENGKKVVEALGSNLITVFRVSLADLNTWLAFQPANTADKPYVVILNVSDIGDSFDNYNRVGNLRGVLLTNNSKYIRLDLSESIFTSFENNAFYGCKTLANVTIPNGVTSIGYGVFSGCDNLTAINVNAANTAYSSEEGVLYNKTKTTLVGFPGGKTGVFTIPTSVTSIYDAAFYECPALTSVIIGSGVKSIGENAFAACFGLANITTPNSVTSIGRMAFDRCTSLTSVTISASVTSIGQEAFNYCTSLTSVTFATGSNIPDANFGNNAFPEGSSIGGGGGNTLKTAYSTGKAGTYTRSANGNTWTKS